MVSQWLQRQVLTSAHCLLQRGGKTPCPLWTAGLQLGPHNLPVPSLQGPDEAQQSVFTQSHGSPTSPLPLPIPSPSFTSSGRVLPGAGETEAGSLGQVLPTTPEHLPTFLPSPGEAK